MLICWNCGQTFREKLVRRDGILRGREPKQGGPYLLYHCPRCHRESRAESTAGGRLFASPEKEISTLDYLFGWIPSLSPVDFLKVVHWHHLHAEECESCDCFARADDGDFVLCHYVRYVEAEMNGGNIFFVSCGVSSLRFAMRIVRINFN